jgi:hypothetical protein
MTMMIVMLALEHEACSRLTWPRGLVQAGAWHVASPGQGDPRRLGVILLQAGSAHA